VSHESRLRVAVAGFGTMGRKHTVNCNRIDGVEVAGIVVADDAERTAVAAETRIPVYVSAEELLAEVQFDVLVAATPPGTRRGMLLAAAADGKALFVEKPIALDLETARQYLDAATRNGVVNAVGFQLRYSPLTEEARDIVSGRSVTHVRTVCTTPYYLTMDIPLWFLQRKHSGGPLLEQSIHVIDMARHLVGDITNVFGRADRLTFPNVEHLDSEDTLVLVYRFENGALGTHVDSCAMTEFNWEIELFGPNWRLLVDYARKRLSGHVDGEVLDRQFPDVDLHILEMRAFLEAVRTGRTETVRSDFADATRTLATMLAGDRSIVTGNWEPVD